MNDLTHSSLTSLLRDAKIRRYPKGQIVLYEGEHPNESFIVKSGAVKIYDIDEDGNEKILHIIKAPAIFPAIFFVGEKDQTNTFYTTVMESEVYVLPRARLEQALENDSKLAVHCMRWFSMEAMEILNRMASLQKTSTRQKLIATLRYLAKKHGSEQKNGWWRIAFAVSHQMLADMIGVTRESTTMVMKELQREKIIRNPRLSMLDIKLSALE